MCRRFGSRLFSDRSWVSGVQAEVVACSPGNPGTGLHHRSTDMSPGAGRPRSATASWDGAPPGIGAEPGPPPDGLSHRRCRTREDPAGTRRGVALTESLGTKLFLKVPDGSLREIGPHRCGPGSGFPSLRLSVSPPQDFLKTFSPDVFRLFCMRSSYRSGERDMGPIDTRGTRGRVCRMAEPSRPPEREPGPGSQPEASRSMSLGGCGFCGQPGCPMWGSGGGAGWRACPRAEKRTKRACPRGLGHPHPRGPLSPLRLVC